MRTTEGIILKKDDAGEYDALFTLYTRDFGKIRALARGIKKEGAKLKGHLEPLNLSRVGLVSGKSGERLIQAETLNSWPLLRRDYERLAAAYHAAALVDSQCFPGDRDEGLWLMLVKSLQKIEKEEKIERDAARLFEKRLLDYLNI